MGFLVDDLINLDLTFHEISNQPTFASYDGLFFLQMRRTFRIAVKRVL